MHACRKGIVWHSHFDVEISLWIIAGCAYFILHSCTDGIQFATHSAANRLNSAAVRSWCSCFSRNSMGTVYMQPCAFVVASRVASPTLSYVGVVASNSKVICLALAESLRRYTRSSLSYTRGFHRGMIRGGLQSEAIRHFFGTRKVGKKSLERAIELTVGSAEPTEAHGFNVILEYESQC
jgi:hypothetical protein